MVNDGTQKVLIRSFEDLECHQAAREFRKRISHFCENLPKEEAYRLKDQIIRNESREETIKKFMEFHQARPVPDGFRYSSGTNTEWLDVEQLRALLRQHVDPAFQS
jgi:hypothetical protein